MERIPLNFKESAVAAVFVGKNTVLKVLGADCVNEIDTLQKLVESRHQLPTFVPIISLAECDAAYVDQLDTLPRRPQTGQLVYINLKSIQPPYTCVTMQRIVSATPASRNDVCSVMMELIATMAMAREQYMFYWGDVQASNLIITQVPPGKTRNYSIGGSLWTTSCQFMPVFMDFGNSSFGKPYLAKYSDLNGIITICVSLYERIMKGRLPTGIIDDQGVIQKGPRLSDPFLNQLQDLQYSRQAISRDYQDSAEDWKPFYNLLLGCPVFFDSFRISTLFDVRWPAILQMDNEAAIDEIGAGQLGTALVYGTPSFASVYSIIRELQIQPGDIILDIGSGLGNVLFLTETLVPADCRLIGIEIRQELHIIAQERRAQLDSRVELYNADFMRFPLQFPPENRLIILQFDVEFPVQLKQHIYNFYTAHAGACKMISCFGMLNVSVPMKSSLIIGVRDPLYAEDDATRYNITSTFLIGNYDYQDILDHNDEYGIDVDWKEDEESDDNVLLKRHVFSQFHDAEQQRNLDKYNAQTNSTISLRNWPMLLGDLGIKDADSYELFLYKKGAAAAATATKKPRLECQICASVGNLLQCPCKEAVYCGKACQRADWGNHASNCRLNP
jgi:SAM-dependent methyltransferase